MEILKKRIAPSVLLIAAGVSGVGLAMGTSVAASFDQPQIGMYLQLLSGLSQAALYVMFAWVARAYYSNSPELGKAAAVLRYSVNIFCVLYGIAGVDRALYAAGREAIMSYKFLAFTTGLLQPAVTIIACLLAMDILGAYLKAKAENALTV